MKRIIKLHTIIVLFFFISYLIYSNTKKDIQSELKEIFKNYNFYYCKKDDLNNILNKKYEKVSLFHIFKDSDFQIDETKNTISYTSGYVCYLGITDCKYSRDQYKINILGYLVGPGGYPKDHPDYEEPKKVEMKLEIYNNYAVLYEGNEIHYLIKWTKENDLNEFLLNIYKLNVFNKIKNYKTNGFKLDNNYYYKDSQKYNYKIYPLFIYKKKKLVLIEDYYIISFDRNNIIIKTLKNSTINICDITNDEIFIKNKRYSIIYSKGIYCFYLEKK